LIEETSGALVVSGSGLRLDGRPGADEVRVELSSGLLSSSPAGCTGQVCVFSAPGGVALGNAMAFPGVLEIHALDGRLFAILELALETYLRGVVSAEVPASWDVEVKMAQAVAARSYALAQIRDREGGYDLMSTTLDQVYRARENPGAVQAVTMTRGEVLASTGAIVEAFYHSTCGGHTEDPADVWPDAPSFPWATTCTTCADSPRYSWEARLRRERVATAHSAVARVDTLVLEERMSSGRVSRVSLVEGEASVSMPAPMFRRAIGTGTVRSAFFEVEASAEVLTLRGRGFGHGVGMCQWGAHGLAAEGRDHLAILAHYYAGTTIVRVYD